MDQEIVLIAHNLRSCHNIGSLLRTAEGLAIKKVYLSGYSPYPEAPNDQRLPYLRQKISKQINKTSLGAENLVDWEHVEDIGPLLKKLRATGYSIVALEQTDNSTPLDKFKPTSNIALIVGREVEGIEKDVLGLVDQVVSIPMLGLKESFNVVQAAAMAMYRLRYL